MSSVELCWSVTSYVSIIVQLITTGLCLGIFVSPYMQDRRKAGEAGAVYGAVMTVLYIMPPRIDNILAYFTGTLAAFLVMCAKDRRNINQKIFLSVTFFSLRWLSVSMAGIINQFSDIVLSKPEIAARVWLHYGLYVAVRILNILFSFLLLLLSVKAVNRAYESKDRYMERRELVMLTVPSLAGVAGYAIFHLNQAQSETTGFYNMLCFLYYLISVITVLAIIIVFQNWKTSQEERSGYELLESQINSIKAHIEGIEKMYEDIHSLRHDMGNHIQMIERLMGTENKAEASAYLDRLKNEWQELTPEIRTGNPVTDMIFLEKKQEAKRHGIRFESDFRYPENAKLDAFDVSVILYNALNNCMESVNGKKPYIRIRAFRKNSIFMLIISNSFEGKILINPANGLPYTTKQGGGHGIGLKNIRRVAKKYMGELSFEQNGNEVTLGIMLQIA